MASANVLGACLSLVESCCWNGWKRRKKSKTDRMLVVGRDNVVVVEWGTGCGGVASGAGCSGAGALEGVWSGSR